MVRTAILAVAAIAIAAGGYFGLLKGMDDSNRALKQQLDDKKAENAKLREFVPKLQDLNRQMAMLQQQLDIQRKIVPDEKDADTFIKLVQDTANASGVEIRRFTAGGVSNKDYYAEMPFDVDVDGPYFAVTNFFERLGKLERIVNASNLAMASITKPTGTKYKGKFQYAPGETVIASCTLSTFFSRPDGPAPEDEKPAKGAKGKKAEKPAKDTKKK